jgi:hypothetical protein
MFTENSQPITNNVNSTINLNTEQNPYGIGEIAFIDSQLPDYQGLIQGLDRNVQIVVLDSTGNGLNQITQTLGSYQDLDAIHLFTHGFAGGLQLGNSILNAGNLADNYTFLNSIGSALSAEGDLLFYGCNVGAETTGQVFLQEISSITGADVAGSTDLTGNAGLGGDWDLEYVVGSVEANVLSNSNYGGVLGDISLDNGELVLKEGDYDIENVYVSVNNNNQLVIKDTEERIKINGSGITKVDNNTVTVDISSINKFKITTDTDALDGDRINIDLSGLTIDHKFDLIVEGDRYDDAINFTGNVNTFGGNIDVDIRNINIEEGVVISTRQTNNTSGNITLKGKEININDNAQLLADVTSGNYQAGDINIEATKFWLPGTDPLQFLTDLGLGGSFDDAKIIVGKSTIFKGNNINLSTDTGGTTELATLIQNFPASSIRALLDLIVGLPIMVMVKKAESIINIGDNSQIIGSGNVSLESYANADIDIAVVGGDSEVDVLDSNDSILKKFSFGLGVGITTAETTIGQNVNITANKNVTILSNAFTQSNVDSRTSQNLGIKPTSKDNKAVAFGISYSEANSYTTIAQGATINAGRNANVLAIGENYNKAAGRAYVYQDGTAGIALGLEISESDIRTEVNGTINAGSAATDIIINLDNNDLIDNVNSQFNLPSPHNFKNGDAVMYKNGDADGQIGGNDSIGGLVHEQVYYLIVDSPNQIKLAESRSKALAGQAIAIDKDDKTGTGHHLHALQGLGTVGIGVKSHLECTDIVQADSGIFNNTLLNKIINFDTSAISTQVRTTFGDKFKNSSEAQAAENQKTLDNKVKAGEKVQQPSKTQKLSQKAFPGKDNTTTGESSQWGLAGSLAVSVANHDVTTKIGGTAKLGSNQDLEIESFHQSITQIEAITDLQKVSDANKAKGVEGPSKETAISASVSAGFYDSDVKTEIADGAILDASRNINIESQIVYPFAWENADLTDISVATSASEVSQWWDNFITDKEDALDGINSTVSVQGPHKAKPWSSWTKSASQAEETGISGSINVLSFNNTNQTIVGSGVEINQNQIYQNLEQAVNIQANTDITLINITGDPLSLTNSMGGKGVGGSVFFLLADNTTEAIVEDGAKIHTGDNQKLTIQANTDVFSSVLAISGGAAEEFGIAGTVVVNLQYNRTIAQLGSGAVITGGGLDILAEDEVDHWNFVGGVVRGNNTGIGMSVGVHNIGREVQALIGNSAELAPGMGTDIDVTGDINIQALSEGDIYTLSLAAAVITPKTPESPKPGPEPEATPGMSSTDPSAEIDDPIDINLIQKTSETGNPTDGIEKRPEVPEATSKDTAGSEAVTNDQGNQGKSGIGISGDVSIHIISDDVLAFINSSGKIESDGNVNIEANNDTNLFTISGSAAISKAQPNSPDSSTGIAGSVAVNIVSGDTKAYIAGDSGTDKLTITADSLDLEATRTGDIFSISAGGAGASGAQGTAVAGSVSVNNITNTTESYIDGAVLILLNDLLVKAKDESDIFAIAGAIALAKSTGSVGATGVGAGIGVNIINNDTKASVKNSTLNDVDNIEVLAENSAEIQALSGAVAASTGGAGGTAAAGTVSVNIINGETLANIENTQKADGMTSSIQTISVTANNNATIQSLSGAVGLSLSTTGNAFGAAIAYNGINDNTSAYISNSILPKSTGTTVSANSDRTIQTISLGLAGGKDLGLAGSASVNIIDGSLTAYIANSTIETTGKIEIQAIANDDIESLSGGVGISSGTAAVGAAISVNQISNNNRAYIFGSTITANSDVNLTAKNTSEISTIALGGGAAKTFALGGSIAVNTINNNSEASIEGNSQIKKATNVNITGQDSSTIESLAGSVGVSASGKATAAVAASIAVNYINNQTKAYINNSTVDATGAVTLNADSTATIKSLSASGAVTTGSAAVSGSFSINIIGGGTQAYINNNSNVKGTGINLSAKNNSSIESLAGNVAGAGKGAVGISLAVNDLDNSIATYIDNSTVTASSNQINLTATSTANIDTVSVGGAGAGTAAVGGSVSVNNINTVTTAYIHNSSENKSITAEQQINITASDDSEISSIAGQVSAAGTAGIGASLSTNNLKNQVKAYIDSSKVTSKTQGVTVQATISPTIENITVGGAGAGTFAFGGSVTVNNVGTQTLAYINNNSTIQAKTNINVLATNNATIKSLAGQVSAAGTAAAGAALAVNNSSSRTSAYIADSNISFIPNSTVGAIKVAATGTNRVESLSAGVSVSKDLSLTGSVSVNNISDTITAYTKNGNISGNSLEISAQDSSTIKSLAGQLSASLGGSVGGAVAYNNIGNTIEAYSQDATIKTTGNVSIKANSQGAIETVAVGGSAGLYAGLAGSVAVNEMTNTTSAYIQGGNVTADGSVGVLANSDSTMITGGGALAGGIAGIGATIVVNNLNNTTQSYLQTANVNAFGNSSLTVPLADGSGNTQVMSGLAVIATSSGNLDLTIGTASAGGLALSGSIAVNSFNDTTAAYINGGTINGDNTTANGEQSVVVKAFNDTAVDVKAGAGAFGGAGIGAAIDVTTVKNGTSAYINNATVNAAKDVTVTAITAKDVNSLVVAAAAGGALGVSGAVSVVNISAGMTGDALTAAADTQEKVNTELSNLDNMGKDSSGNSNINTKKDVVSNLSGNSVTVEGTTAFISGTVNAGRNITILSDETSKLGITSGAGALGALGVGGAVGIGNITHHTSSYIGANANITATGNIEIRSSGLVASSEIKSYAGAAGLVGLGAAVSDLTSQNNSSAYIGNGAKIHQANSINVVAGSSSNLNAEGWGAAAGAFAAGVVIGNAEETGTTQAYVGNEVIITNANSLNINATAKEAVSAIAQAAAGGTNLAVSGSVPTATVSPTVKAFVGDNANIQVNNDVTIISDVTIDGDAEAKGVSIGSIAVGVSLAEVNAKPNIDTYIGAFTTINANDVTVKSRLGQPITVGDTSFNPNNAVNNSQNTIKFNSDHGLQTGDQVVYINGGGSDIGGLTNQSSYNVIAVDSQTVKLGTTFNAAEVDVRFNTINFNQNHGFQDGDQVVYEAAGGNVIGGLVAGNSYYVKVVDSQTIKLTDTATVSDVTQGTTLANINTTSPDTVITINDHGFQNGDQLNYQRRVARFSIVDTLPDTQGKDNIFNLDSDVINNNRINSASHGFENDDQVIYSSDGDALGGLISGNTYYVVNKTDNNFQLSATKGGTAIDITSVPTDAKNQVIDSNHQITAVGLKIQQVDQFNFSYTTDNANNTITLNNHGFIDGQEVVYKTSGTPLTGLTPGNTYYIKKVDNNSFQLANTAGGTTIDIGANGNTHQLVVNQGIQDVESGVPYYVVGATQNSFKLAATQGGTALTLSKDNLTGTGFNHLFTEENVIDLTSAGTGTQNLHIDLNNSTATGTNHLLSSGANATIPSQEDNKFSVYSQASAGALVGVTGTEATLNITPTMKTYVGNNTKVTATGNVTIDSLSSVETTGTTTSRVFGAIAVGASEINVTLNNNNTTYVSDAAEITADGNVVINGQTAQTVNVSADGGAGSLITFADTDAHADLTYNNQTYIGNFAQITAKNELTVNSTSNTDGNIKAVADGVGIYADADANSSFEVDGSNLTNINQDVKLTGRTVNIQAIVDQLNVESRSEAEGAGLIGNIDAHARVNLDGTESNVNIHSGTYIIGDYINLDAKFNTISSNAMALADCDGLGGDTDTNATNNMPLTAKVWTDSNSTLEVYKLNVESDFTNFQRTTTAESDLAWSLTIWTPFGDITITMDFGDESESETYKPAPIIDFNSNVKLLAREANPVLIVDENGNIIQQSDNVTATITATDIIVSDIDNASVGEVNFTIPDRTSEMFDNGQFTDRGKYTIIDPAYDNVDIQNYSDRNLIINDISVINPGGIPPINYDVNVSNKTIATTTPNLGSLPVNPTIVTINNWGNSDLILQGVIDNPHDRTILYSTDNIFSVGNTQNIITRDLTITAVNGSIGTDIQRINAELQQGYSPVTAEVPSSNIYLESVAQGSVYLNLGAKQLDSNSVVVDVEKMTATTGEVNININQTTDKLGNDVEAIYRFTTEYNPDGTIKATSSIIAGTDITINADTTTTNIFGNTDFLNDGLLDVVTGGYIILTELTGGLNLYRAISSQSGILITTTESANLGEDILLVDNAVVEAANNVTFQAGDNFQIQPTATITAGNNVIIKGDHENQDDAGTVVNIYGWIYSQLMDIYGESNEDVFNIRRLATSTRLFAGEDDDIVNVGSNQPEGSGNVDEILTSLVLYGEGENNIDTLNIDDWGDTSDNVGILTDKSLTGLDMGEGIYYYDFELFNLKLGTGNDDLTVLNTGATTNIDANLGNDRFRFGPQVDADGQVISESVDGVNTSGENIFGTSHITNLNTGNGADYIQVNRNTAVLNIQAGNDDDILEVNTPINNSSLLNNGRVNFSAGSGSDQTIVNGSKVSETINIDGASLQVQNSRVVSLNSSESLVVNGNLGNDIVNIDTGSSSNITNLEVNGNAGSDSVNLFSLLSTITATLNGNDNNDTFTFGSQTGFAPTLNTILGTVNVVGGAGTDVLNLNDLRDRNDNNGTLTSNTLTGLGLNSLNYESLETLNLNLGIGDDTLTVENTHTGVTNIKANDGNDVVNLRANAGNTFVWLGKGDDILNVGSLQPNSGGTLNQLTQALTVYGEEDSTGDVLNVDDSGDTSNNNGVLTKDKLTGLGMGAGINYYTLETLNINLGSGADSFTSLDTGAVTNLNTGAGNDTVRIGPNLDSNGNPVTESNPRLSANLIYGTSYAMSVNTGAGNDAITVNRNVGNLTLSGEDGNDSFELNTASDRTSSPGFYANGNVTLDAGNGTDEIVVNGSYRAETIAISSQGVQVNNSRNTTFSNVESLTANGNRGSDDISVNTENSSSLTEIEVNGGVDNDTLSVAGLLATINLTMLGDSGNDNFNLGNANNLLSQILGVINIDGGRNTDNVVFNHQGDNNGVTGTLTATTVTGLSLGNQGVSYANLEDLTVNLGNGGDNVTVNDTHAGTTNINTNGGDDTVAVNDITGVTNINVGTGDDEMLTQVTPSNSGLTFFDPDGKTATVSGEIPTSSTSSSSGNTANTNNNLPTTQLPNSTTGISSNRITPPTRNVSDLLNSLRNRTSSTTASISRSLPTTQPIINTGISSNNITPPTTSVSSLLDALRSRSSSTTTVNRSLPTTQLPTSNTNTSSGISSSRITPPSPVTSSPRNISSLLNDLRSRTLSRILQR